jgi:hypothetical protein
MKLQPLFEDRPFALQLIGAIVVPVVFGIVTGLALGWNGILYWILVGPLAVIGGFLGGTEHLGSGEGFVRGLLGGLVYGSFVLIGFEIANTEAKAYLSHPQVGLVYATTLIGGVLGALGGAVRAKLERDPRLPRARPPTASAGP